MSIEALRRKRAEVAASVQGLADIEAKDGALTDEQMSQFNAFSTEFDDLSASIKRLETAERMAAESAAPVPAYGGGAPAVHVKPELKQYPGAKMARMAMAIAAGGGNLDQAAKFATSEIGDMEVAMAVETSAGSGGALVPTNLHEEVIEELRPQTIARSLGATEVPLPNGNLTLGADKGGATAFYTGEGQDATTSETQYGDVALSAKTVITMVPMSNELIGYVGPKVERLVLGSMMNAMRLREDKAAIRDDGTNKTPVGFRKTALDAGRTIPFAGDPNDYKDIDAYLDLMILQLLNSNSNMTSPGWGFSPRTFIKIQGLRDGNGNKVYPEMANGFLKGYPFRNTTQIPQNLGAGSNESEIYFADWNDVLIGETDGMGMDFSKEATYKNSNGDLVSAFSQNQTVIRLTAANDIGFRHVEGLCLGTAVTF